MRRPLHRLPSFARLGEPAGFPATTVVETVPWPAWLRGVERSRKSLLRHTPDGPPALPPIYFAHATFVSLRLEGIEIDRQHVTDALSQSAAQRAMRSKLTQRIRNHVSILRHIEQSLSNGEPLTLQHVLRWYTSMSCGLCPQALSDGEMVRLDRIVRQINSPHLRLQPAVQEIANLHAHIMADPLVPSFSGILNRLLLRFHLGRCNLPPVFFDPETPPAVFRDEQQLLPRLLHLIDDSYRFLTDSR